MVWHQVTIAAANQAMDSLIAKTKGVNVIAPTWFTLSSNSGAYESLADKSYVDRAHEKRSAGLGGTRQFQPRMQQERAGGGASFQDVCARKN